MYYSECVILTSPTHLEPDFDLGHLHPDPLHPLSDLSHQPEVVLLLGLHGMVDQKRPELAILLLDHVGHMNQGGAVLFRGEGVN